MKYDFSAIEKAILTQNVEILIKYKDKLYWITVGKKSFFGESGGIVSLTFATPQKLLESVLIDNKILSEIWNEVEVESFEGGWSKTINT